MSQQKRKIATQTEGHGDFQTQWHDYEVLCPECNQWSSDYGEVSTVIDGEDYWLCDDCGYRIADPHGYGAKCCRANKPTNPYSKGTTEHDLWVDGWDWQKGQNP